MQNDVCAAACTSGSAGTWSVIMGRVTEFASPCPRSAPVGFYGTMSGDSARKTPPAPPRTAEQFLIERCLPETPPGQELPPFDKLEKMVDAALKNATPELHDLAKADAAASQARYDKEHSEYVNQEKEQKKQKQVRKKSTQRLITPHPRLQHTAPQHAHTTPSAHNSSTRALSTAALRHCAGQAHARVNHVQTTWSVSASHTPSHCVHSV